MKNTFGSSLSVTLFGESHGEAIGVVIDGLAPGIVIKREKIDKALAKRRPSGKISTARAESDPVTYLSGVYEGKTTGAPLTILIPNQNKKSEDYRALADTPRPSHADFCAEAKYHGYQDPRGGGHFSGRLTAALVAAGAIVSSALEDALGIRIATHILSVKGERDSEMRATAEEIDLLSTRDFPTLNNDAEARMRRVIEAAAEMGDSVGGILESTILGVPSGIGEPFFDSVESVLSHLLFSVGGVKGVEFGAGFAITDMYGSRANDPFIIREGKIETATNNSGGIQGGITNGMPILVRTAIKPTPSIYKEQKTVSLAKKEPTTLTLGGRHDPCIVHRVAAVVDAMLAIGIADLIVTHYGTDVLREGLTCNTD